MSEPRNPTLAPDSPPPTLGVATATAVAGALLLIGIWNITAIPALWWDEGWTLCVARNWVERGHYGCLLNGQPAPPELSGHFPLVVPVALSFQLFGVGIWQARITGVLFAIGAVLLVGQLTAKLYNRSIALAALAIALLLPVKWYLHPLIIGRQVLGESPALFFQLLGVASFLSPRWWLRLFAPVSWGVALMAKAQVWPFWLCSMAVPLLIMSLRKRWRSAAWHILGLIGSPLVLAGLHWFKEFCLRGHTLPPAEIAGLTEVSAIVMTLSVRWSAVSFVFTFGLPAALGLSYAGHQLWRSRRDRDANETVLLGRLILLVLSASWLGWFVCLSVGWIRYAYPPLLLASPFVAALLFDLGFRRFDWRGAAAWGLVALMGLFTLRTLCLFAQKGGDTSAVETARFLNTTTAADARIETWDSELFLLLNRPYHYPPPQLDSELIRWAFLNQEAVLAYDPLQSDPDYLVVGLFSKNSHLYESAVTAGAFVPLRTIGRYQIYQRARSASASSQRGAKSRD